MKPTLPMEIQLLLPEDIVRVINSYVPHLKKQKPTSISPSLQTEISRIQRSAICGKNEMYLRGFDDFILD